MAYILCASCRHLALETVFHPAWPEFQEGNITAATLSQQLAATWRAVFEVTFIAAHAKAAAGSFEVPARSLSEWQVVVDELFRRVEEAFAADPGPIELPYAFGWLVRKA